MKRKMISVLGTGGTIAGVAATKIDNISYASAQIEIQDLVASISDPLGINVDCEQIAQVDSKSMDFEIWRTLAIRCEHWLSQKNIAGIVISHGTDTIEETAYFLHRVLNSPTKPVVLTCAMRPATSLSPDGPQNLNDALIVASAPGAKGVVVVCDGVIHSSVDVFKQHTTRVNAFSSGTSGPLGYVEGGGVSLIRGWPASSNDKPGSPQRWMTTRLWPRVEVVMNYAGNDGSLVRALVRDGVEGIVAAGTGNGSLHRALEQALVEAAEKGLKVVRSSRCALGRVLPRKDDRLPHSDGLQPAKARIDLMLRLLEEGIPGRTR